MITLEDRKIKNFEKTLDRFTKDGFPRATQFALNEAAFNSSKSAKRIIDENLVIKGGKKSNPAIHGVQFSKTKSLDVRQQETKVGHVAAFWPVQEFGGIVHKRGSEGVAIPTGAAAAQAGTKHRTKQVRPTNRLSKIRLSRGALRAKTRQQKNAIAIRQARAGGGPAHVFLDLGRRKGIFRVTKRKIVMLHDLTRASVRIQPSPAIHPAAERQEQFIPENYERALKFQLRKVGAR